jgi:hypothetical protein
MYPKIGLKDGKQGVILDEEHDLLHLPRGPHWKESEVAFIMMIQKGFHSVKSNISII